MLGEGMDGGNDWRWGFSCCSWIIKTQAFIKLFSLICACFTLPVIKNKICIINNKYNTYHVTYYIWTYM